MEDQTNGVGSVRRTIIKKKFCWNKDKLQCYSCGQFGMFKRIVTLTINNIIHLLK